jgi:hypothetical protein
MDTLMSEAELETFLLRIALPSVRFGLYVKRLTARRNGAGAAAAISELRRTERLRARLARQGWWN